MPNGALEKGVWNFRAISLLPLLSKVIEKGSISLVFEKKAFHGFDKGLMTSMTLINPKNVFATIDHVVLLKILHAKWFSEHGVNWFRLELSNTSFVFPAV